MAPPTEILSLTSIPCAQVNGKNLIGVTHKVAVQMLRAECEECTFVVQKKPSNVPNIHVTKIDDTTHGEDAKLVDEAASSPPPSQSPPPDSSFKESEVPTLSEAEKEELQPNPV